MKRVGIVTHYYNSKNYGGNLQSYALVKVLNKLGYQAEQIPVEVFYDLKKESFKEKIKRLFKQKGILSFIGYCSIYLLKKIFHHCNKTEYMKNIEVRAKAISTFNLSIPHYDSVLKSNQVNCTDLGYDFYISGSDQVWNPDCWCNEYFLTFVSLGKIKISYAASISKSNLTDDERQELKEKLKDFKAISVREKQDISLLEELAPCKPIMTLDPTLLLEQEDWESIASPRLIEEKYIFCYFLGNNKNNRKKVVQFAKNKNYKIVTLPHLVSYVNVDKNFGDYQLYDIAPSQFISLIKYAEYVFTDSFHAVVFSTIFKKQYFVFDREENKCMSSRIINITEMTHNESRYCDTAEKNNKKYILNQENIDYANKLDDLNMLKVSSIKFLKDNLK